MSARPHFPGGRALLRVTPLLYRLGMSYRTASLTAAGHVARSTDGRNTAMNRWPTGEQHAADDDGNALCGAEVAFIFDEKPFEPSPQACLDCVLAAFK